MKTMTITKADVIAALKNEELNGLRGGNWIDMPFNAVCIGEFGTFENGGCSVCAVGSVLRQVLEPAQSQGFVAKVAWANADGKVSEGYMSTPLAKLSDFFEEKMRGHYSCTESIRQACISFVRRTFPETFRIKLPEAF